jgi:hypothetical protein
LQLNPMLVFLALWFGGMFWGIAGIVLATPALVALKVIAAHARGGAPLLDFLSPHSEAEDEDLESAQGEAAAHAEAGAQAESGTQAKAGTQAERIVPSIP